MSVGRLVFTCPLKTTVQPSAAPGAGSLSACATALRLLWGAEGETEEGRTSSSEKLSEGWRVKGEERSRNGTSRPIL